MRRVQEAAIGLFEERGFEAVTIEQIARQAGVSPPTVYRGFGTKERLVLWDEYDPLLLEAISARLPARSLTRAVRDALVECLGEVYRRDRARILRRARLQLGHPALLAASTAEQALLRQALAELFLSRRARRTRLQADVAAGAIVAALEAAVSQWVREKGRPSLRVVLGQAFEQLERLA